MTDQTNPDDLKKCPLCAEPIKRKAIFCKHCHTNIVPSKESRLSTGVLPEPKIPSPEVGILNTVVESHQSHQGPQGRLQSADATDTGSKKNAKLAVAEPTTPARSSAPFGVLVMGGIAIAAVIGIALTGFFSSRHGDQNHSSAESQTSVPTTATEPQAEKQFSSSPSLTPDELRTKFNVFASEVDGLSMERPTTEQNEFNCDVADGIRMSGVTTASNKIRSIKLIMARQYEGGSSVMVTRVFRWLEAIYFVVQSLDPLMTKDSTKELVTTLGIVGGEGRKPDLKNLNSVTEKNGFKYVAFTRNDPPMLEFSATNGRETAEADTSRTPAISQSTEQETNSRSSNEKDVYTVTDDYTTVFDSETACAAYDTDNQWNAPNVNAISEIKGKWTSTDSLAKGAKVRILEKRGKCARVEVLSGSMAVDGRGSGWMSLNMLTETRAVMPPEQVLRSSHSEPNPAQPSSVPVRSNVQATASDSAALIDKILEAEKGSDESSINEIKTRLTAIPKPVPGDGAEATRLNKIGLQALKTKEYQTAVTYFQSASNADPSDAKLLSNLGFAEMNVGNLNAARKHLNLSIASDPTRAVAWGDLGLVFAKTGEQDKAVSALLVGYRVSNGKTLNFLESLAKDDDPAFHEAGSIALSKVSSLPGLSHGPSAAGASSGAPTHGDGMSVPASAPTRVGRSAGGGSGGGSTVAIKPSANADGNGVPNANDPFASSSPSPKIDYEAFMKDLERRIKRAWFPPKFEEPKTMTVKFRVHQGGALSDLEIKDSSGSSIDDQAALKAVENASPFRPLPSGSEENIEIIFKFDDTNRSSRSTHGVISN